MSHLEDTWAEQCKSDAAQFIADQRLVSFRPAWSLLCFIGIFRELDRNMLLENDQHVYVVLHI